MQEEAGRQVHFTVFQIAIFFRKVLFLRIRTLKAFVMWCLWKHIALIIIRDSLCQYSRWNFHRFWNVQYTEKCKHLTGRNGYTAECKGNFFQKLFHTQCHTAIKGPAKSWSDNKLPQRQHNLLIDSFPLLLKPSAALENKTALQWT